MYAIRSYYESRLITDPLRTLAYGTDASFYRLIPQIVVRVETKQEVIDLIRMAGSQRLPRITSYNVCYTKLLRGWRWLAWYDTAQPDLSSRATASCTLVSRITSYNVCYTKLLRDVAKTAPV